MDWIRDGGDMRKRLRAPSKSSSPECEFLNNYGPSTIVNLSMSGSGCLLARTGPGRRRFFLVASAPIFFPNLLYGSESKEMSP